MKNRNRKRRLVAKVESMEGRCLLSAAPQFSIKDLGVASTIGGINQLGQVVGMIEPTDWGSSVVALSGQDGSPLKPLVPVPGFDFDISCGIAVNDSSQVLFSAIPGENGSNSPSLYFYSNGRLTSISDSVGHLYSPGNPLNNSGNIVGHLQSNDHAFFYNGTTHDLGTLGGTYSLALGINDSNQIVGSSSTGLGQSSPFHAFFYDGSMRDLGTLGGDYSEAWGINASGQVIGISSTADGHIHRFISSPNGGALHDLGEGYFVSINDQGQAVGEQNFFDGTHIIDLNTLIVQNQGFSSISAFAINNSDQVAATGVDMSGQTHALLLTPIPPVAPTITWSNPADIVYGTPLSATQLNATASVPGTFTYSVPEGTVLHAGAAQSLVVTFTPDDTTNYTTVTATASINVLPAPLTVTASNAQIRYGFMIPPLTGEITGLVNGDTDVATYTTTAVQGSWAGYYPIVPHLTDPNYNITFVNGTLTIYWSVPPAG